MYFLRDTRHPGFDLKRGFSGNVNAWFDREQDARDYAKRHAAILTPAQCPLTLKWCGDPEKGLSGFAFADADGVADAARLIEPYVAGDRVQVFRSLEWDAQAGLEGEDCFRGGQHLLSLPWPPSADDFREALEEWREDRYTNGRCHLMALALHRMTGWPLAALLDYAEPFDEETPAVAHVYVDHPDGGIVDIRGHALEDSLLDLFPCGDPKIVRLTDTEVADMAGEEAPLHAYNEADLALAAEDAREVLEQLEAEQRHWAEARP